MPPTSKITSVSKILFRKWQHGLINSKLTMLGHMFAETDDPWTTTRSQGCWLVSSWPVSTRPPPPAPGWVSSWPETNLCRSAATPSRRLRVEKTCLHSTMIRLGWSLEYVSPNNKIAPIYNQAGHKTALHQLLQFAVRRRGSLCWLQKFKQLLYIDCSLLQSCIQVTFS